MKLKELKIKNFRCFEQYYISFAAQSTILIGKNGTGKTTLLNAIKASLSFIFSKYQTKNESFKLLGTNAYLSLVTLKETDAFFNIDKKLYEYPIDIHAIANFEQTIIDWAIVKNTSNSKLLDTKYREAFMSFIKQYNQDLQNSPLPVLAYFSDSYPHTKTNIGSYAKGVLESGNIPRAFGYYQWDADTSCAEIWQNRYVSQYSKVNDFKRTEEDTKAERDEIEFIDNRIKIFTEQLEGNYDFINPEFKVNKIVMDRPLKNSNSVSIKFIFENRREIFFEHLPQGYNRLLSIVFDIAYRSYILNGLHEPQGIVIIDELELHLHPTLQQEVLQRFQKTFPQIQFIISTHSPLIISNQKADGETSKIIKLENDGDNYTNQDIDNIYGIDYSTNLSEIMEVAPRSTTIDKYINAYLFLYGKNKQEEADKMLKKLEQYVGGEIPSVLKEEINQLKKSYK
ncbi:AAA family ATPase [Cellulophaga sp. BC115SP]|uniref:AAA family ATPase n=1 Tax=Cellulophaga sp. BC115SP TaxID=2683263 RepID=UPI00141364A0|nr:AAA family ATPase [Cellulophaga sp. BC115SP]NBB28673.1 AAA family ATPase [Cellulophaga sp. BC115SP]